MIDADDDLSSFRDGHWRVQPRWVKALALLIALPAWVVLMVSIFTGTIGGTLQTVAFSAFAAVALLQLVFIFRAYWRMDL
jgi:sterol desaturase/sphingolipid hydroxylase (fatty acid hydroxylase superfamily)